MNDLSTPAARRARILSWLDARSSLVDPAVSPRLALAAAALRDLDACSVEYGRTGNDSLRNRRPLDTVFVRRCDVASVLRYEAPSAWSAVGTRRVSFQLERDARGDAWRVHAWGATPEELASALEEVAPALRAPR